jgi:hypothetical protein
MEGTNMQGYQGTVEEKGAKYLLISNRKGSRFKERTGSRESEKGKESN